MNQDGHARCSVPRAILLCVGHGQTICQSCYDTCKGSGFWPAEVNGFECLGGD